MRSAQTLLLAALLALPFAAHSVAADEEYTFEYVPLDEVAAATDSGQMAPVEKIVAEAPVAVEEDLISPVQDIIASVQTGEIYGPFKTDTLEMAEFASALDASAVAEDTLGESRGAYSPDLLSLNNSYLNANSGNNVNIGGVTGNNLINGGSFTNTQGLVNVIQNSGNNVVIQSSTIVNMTMIGN